MSLFGIILAAGGDIDTCRAEPLAQAIPALFPANGQHPTGCRHGAWRGGNL